MRRPLLVVLLILFTIPAKATPRVFGKEKRIPTPQEEVFKLPPWVIANIQITHSLTYEEKDGVFAGKWAPDKKTSLLLSITDGVIYRCEPSRKATKKDTFDCTYQRIEQATAVVQILPHGYGSMVTEVKPEKGVVFE